MATNPMSRSREDGNSWRVATHFFIRSGHAK